MIKMPYYSIAEKIVIENQLFSYIDSDGRQRLLFTGNIFLSSYN